MAYEYFTNVELRLCADDKTLEFGDLAIDSENPYKSQFYDNILNEIEFVISIETKTGIECWTLIQAERNEGTLSNVIGVVQEIYEDCEECMGECRDTCTFAERTIAVSQMVNIPTPEVPNRGFEDCCYHNIVLAQLVGNDYDKNDFNSFFFKKQTPTDHVQFKLLDLNTNNHHLIIDNTFGVYTPIEPSQPDLATFKVEWNKVLNQLGEGTYQIKKELTIGGIQVEELSNTFELKEYSNQLADKTIRIDSVMNGRLVHLGTSFKGTNYTDSVRIKGYFGNRQPEYEEDKVAQRNYTDIQVSMQQNNSYTLHSELLPSCISEHIFDFLLFGDKIYINDFNSVNHSYKYTKFLVKLDGGDEQNYYGHIGNRNMKINLRFTDGLFNKRKENC